MDTFDILLPQVRLLADRLTAKGWRLATAESCTGGLIAAACTALPGSSHWFDRGFVTYSNEAKTEMLGVDAGSIQAHGAVSESVARAMALGALTRARVDIAVAVTGVAGPDGGSVDKPVGMVWLAWARNDGRVEAARVLFEGDRADVRRQTCAQAIEGLMRLMTPPR